MLRPGSSAMAFLKSSAARLYSASFMSACARAVMMRTFCESRMNACDRSRRAASYSFREKWAMPAVEIGFEVSRVQGQG